MNFALSQVGVVVIGRNEGERLHRCLHSLRNCQTTVYVDSDSTDNSVAIAQQLGVEVVQLDMTLPFSAARARNEGVSRLRQRFPDLPFIQFIDGDCEVADGWLEQAAAKLQSNSRLAVVAGRRRERHPDQSIYNRLCDIEWNTPIGNAKACGGDAMMRACALDEVGGFNSSVIAGEEPELCVRLRAAGWHIERLDAEMTLHDAAMTRFQQWWRRMERSGHAYAQGVSMHGAAPEHHWVRQQRSIFFWGALIPLVAIFFAWPTHGASLLLLAGHIALVAKVNRYYRSRGFSSADARIAAVFDVLAKFPQVLGAITFHLNRFFAKETALIEYKGATT
ncbi:glycosyltransferase [Planctomycetes bacterium K23_9]|uniref:Glycosyl transferase family 2 n=1 Tax=Stieleria marina TaxID=1930275 RepID=A0A517NNT8_9BACT|nr:Glycosyl transferase family 2 [Planctomycetes bacterium K23_9]